MPKPLIVNLPNKTINSKIRFHDNAENETERTSVLNAFEQSIKQSVGQRAGEKQTELHYQVQFLEHSQPLQPADKRASRQTSSPALDHRAG